MEKVTVTITLDRNEIVDLANKLDPALQAGRYNVRKWRLDATMYKSANNLHNEVFFDVAPVITELLLELGDQLR